ncbi:MAG: AAA family ATPase, partial [Pseudonocardiaceae bacterium]
LTPLDEPAQCALLRRLAAAGDRAGALATGRAFAQRLRAELGVAPGPATRAVLAQLRGPTIAGGASPGGAARPLFGRTRELAALAEAWSAAGDGRGRVVVVTGEGGIGKTRLVAELARRAGNAGGRVAVGAGVDVGGEAPLTVWQELARQLVRAVPVPPEDAGWPQELGRLAPDLPWGWAGPGSQRRSLRPSWSGCGSSTGRCGWWSGPRPAARYCSWRKTCTAPTGPACS